MSEKVSRPDATELGNLVFDGFCIFSYSQVAASLSLMRRLPPSKIEQNLNGLLNLIPEETEELLQRVDQPLKEATDPETVSL